MPTRWTCPRSRLPARSLSSSLSSSGSCHHDGDDDEVLVMVS